MRNHDSMQTLWITYAIYRGLLPAGPALRLWQDPDVDGTDVFAGVLARGRSRSVCRSRSCCAASALSGAVRWLLELCGMAQESRPRHGADAGDQSRVRRITHRVCKPLVR